MPSEPDKAKQWQFGLRDIFLVTAVAAFLMAVGQFPGFHGSVGVLLHVFAVLVAIYIMKFRLSVATLRRRDLGLLFGVLLIALLPYVYWRIVDWRSPFFFTPMGKWVGHPIWVFAVPTASFFAFDIKGKTCGRRQYATRSVIELVVIFPIWSHLWLFIQGAALGWFWI